MRQVRDFWKLCQVLGVPGLMVVGMIACVLTVLMYWTALGGPSVFCWPLAGAISALGYLGLDEHPASATLLAPLSMTIFHMLIIYFVLFLLAKVCRRMSGNRRDMRDAGRLSTLVDR